MARQRVSKGSVIIHKEEKFKKVFEELGEDNTKELFIEKFKEMFPKDWERVVKRYNEHKKLSKPGKPFPMPEPNKYMENAYKTYKNKVAKSS